MQANQQCLLHMNWPPACPILFGLLCLMMNFVSRRSKQTERLRSSYHANQEDADGPQKQ